MMVPKIATSPVYVATSPESNPFYEYVSAYDFCRYPYYGGGGGVHSERLSPESTTVDANPLASGGDDLRDVDPDEIAAIYKQSDFVAFRQRYLESLGPPKNFEKMRRSVPNKKPPGPDGQQCDTYVMKRKKNNEAAKRSRDAKRQKYVENQISVMYLTKKVSEMKEIKRRLLMSM
ncbi:D site-binding protein-like [Adelges cooleyi]|uniref:D site-binding protein-like n=1 Tax=Adelges cooleyi TaxID=133065 RepID=UPI00217F7E49|nr:D site-binding protein-like [Adelges cooleyi]